MTDPHDHLWIDAVRAIVGAAVGQAGGAPCDGATQYLIRRELATHEELAALSAPEVAGLVREWVASRVPRRLRGARRP